MKDRGLSHPHVEEPILLQTHGRHLYLHQITQEIFDGLSLLYCPLTLRRGWYSCLIQGWVHTNHLIPAFSIVHWKERLLWLKLKLSVHINWIFGGQLDIASNLLMQKWSLHGLFPLVYGSPVLLAIMDAKMSGCRNVLGTEMHEQ